MHIHIHIDRQQQCRGRKRDRIFFPAHIRPDRRGSQLWRSGKVLYIMSCLYTYYCTYYDAYDLYLLLLYTS